VLALLYDIHGNLAALDAVLEDARREGAERWLLGGDYALFGPEPAATVARLRELEGATWIRGNGERWTARPAEAADNPVVAGAIPVCRDELGDTTVEELGALPEEAVLGAARFVHGSPISDVRSFAPEEDDEDEELLGGVAETRVVFGHTHLPFRRRSAGGVELVNPGSVGLPFDGDRRAAYAIVRDDGSVEHRRVEYDVGASAARMRERWPGAEWAETVARRIEQARVDA
jgi:predicted phosphodiesterase